MSTLVACLRRHVEATQPDRVPTHFGPATRLRRPKSPWNQGALATSQVEMCPRTANSGLTDGGLAFPSTWCPAGTPAETLVSVEGRRWAVEDAFETAKDELGLDSDETRGWHGWHRHVSLATLAFAMPAVIRHRANAAAPPRAPIGLGRTRPTSSARPPRSPAPSPAGTPGAASGPPRATPGRSRRRP